MNRCIGINKKGKKCRYKIKDNQRKSILLKIPGTGQFRQINYLIFENISNQISRLIKIYKNKLQILDNQ